MILYCIIIYYNMQVVSPVNKHCTIYNSDDPPSTAWVISLPELRLLWPPALMRSDLEGTSEWFASWPLIPYVRVEHQNHRSFIGHAAAPFFSPSFTEGCRCGCSRKKHSLCYKRNGEQHALGSQNPSALLVSDSSHQPEASCCAQCAQEGFSTSFGCSLVMVYAVLVAVLQGAKYRFWIMNGKLAPPPPPPPPPLSGLALSAMASRFTWTGVKASSSYLRVCSAADHPCGALPAGLRRPG